MKLFSCATIHSFLRTLYLTNYVDPLTSVIYKLIKIHTYESSKKHENVTDAFSILYENSARDNQEYAFC